MQNYPVLTWEIRPPVQVIHPRGLVLGWIATEGDTVSQEAEMIDTGQTFLSAHVDDVFFLDGCARNLDAKTPGGQFVFFHQNQILPRRRELAQKSLPLGGRGQIVLLAHPKEKKVAPNTEVTEVLLAVPDIFESIRILDGHIPGTFSIQFCLDFLPGQTWRLLNPLGPALLLLLGETQNKIVPN
jgi:hypothetical protein